MAKSHRRTDRVSEESRRCTRATTTVHRPVVHIVYRGTK